MFNAVTDDQLIKKILSSSKTIAMVGVSSIKEKEDSKNIKRKPSVIVMKYMQEFGYRVLPVNPKSIGKKIHQENIFASLEDIAVPIDIVNVFRPTSEACILAKQAVKIGTKVLWLQYGIHSLEAQEIVKSANITYVGNRCIKQEYQRLFLKMSPVFPALKTN